MNAELHGSSPTIVQNELLSVHAIVRTYPEVVYWSINVERNFYALSSITF